MARLSKASSHAAPSRASARIELALINNMPDAALAATERQFVSLLNAAATDMPVRLRFFSLPSVPRSQRGEEHLRAYDHIAALWNTAVDGVIVTGTEPRTASLENEPYWDSLAQLAEWAKENSVSAIWSCLAAHACVLHLDGIRRQPLPEKQLGVFRYARAADHPVLAGMSSSIRVVHSRYNELPEAGLCAAGYTILTRSAQFGVDAFLKGSGKSQFVFCQGHPEYDDTALLREYRRDVGRFLRNEQEAYPPLPRGYFSQTAAHAAARFKVRAMDARDPALLESFPYELLKRGVARVDRASGVQLYRNWLLYLRERRGLRLTFSTRRVAQSRTLTNASETIA